MAEQLDRNSGGHKMTELVSQHCEACRRDEPHASEVEIAEYLPQIPEWESIEEDGIKRLHRNDFVMAAKTDRLAMEIQ
jgi:hypothetical protein